jgi:hypothetical protein
MQNRDPDASLQLTNDQTGVAGDITAARKVRVIEGSDASDWRAEKPSRLANALYVEWYSETNGRVVIESARAAAFPIRFVFTL